MRRHIAHRAVLKPFSVLREVGLSSTSMQRLERYRTKHERHNRVVGVLIWPDGTWCALAMHTEKFSAVIIDEGQQSDAYEDARSRLDGGYLPLISLHWKFHG